MNIQDHNKLDEKFAHARALATLLYGEQGTTFRQLNDSIQDDAIHLLATLIDEAHEAWERIEAERKPIDYGPAFE